MRKLARLRARGLSLVELLLGLAITALVLAPLVPMLQTAQAAGTATADQLALERDADFALERIAARIRATDPSTTLSATPTDWLTPAVYSVKSNTLVETMGGVDRVLADSVTDFQLSAPVIDAGRPLIRVSLSLARGNASVSANTAVRMGDLQ